MHLDVCVLLNPAQPLFKCLLLSLLADPLLFLLSLRCTPGSKAAAVEYPNNMYHVGSPVGTAPLQVVQLAKDLKLALELQPNQEERESLRAQLPSETTQALINWLQNGEVRHPHLFPSLYINAFTFCCVHQSVVRSTDLSSFMHFLSLQFARVDFRSRNNTETL